MGCLQFIIKMIQMTATNIFIKTLTRFRKQQKISEIAKECKKQLKINIFRTIHLRVGDIIDRFSHFQKKYQALQGQDSTSEWREDEKKVFLCFLLAFCRLSFRKVSQITHQQWQDISKVFQNKDILVLKYEGRVLQRSSQRVRWSRKEELFLQNCIKNSMKGKWAQISKQIFFESEGRCSKTPKQCRQHWFNHMDKQIKRGQWDIEQDLIILESVVDYGHKWARIVDLLTQKRTQHMIKNRFHSILTAFNKFRQQFKRNKNQPRMIKNLIKELTRKKKMMANYKKISLSQLSSSSQKSNILQQQILSGDNYRPSQVKSSIKIQETPESSERSIQIQNLQKSQEKIIICSEMPQHRSLIYQTNPYAFNMAENNIFYGASSYNPLFVCPMFPNYNNAFYTI